MNDMLTEATDFFLSGQNPLRPEQATVTIRKLFGVAIFASFTSGIEILDQFATVLREQIVRPLTVELQNGMRDKAEDGFPVMLIDMMAALLGSASSYRIDPTKKPPRAWIEHLVGLCYRHSSWAWHNLRLFDWLAAFLNRRHGTPGLTGEMLLVAAEHEHAQEPGPQLMLPGFEELISR